MTYHWYLLWPCFIFGQLLYILKRAAMAIRSATNPVSSRWEYFYTNWDILFYRLAFAGILFGLWGGYPDTFTRICKLFGMNFDLTVPLDPPVAVLAGLFCDVLLDWLFEKIPALSRGLPPLNGKH